MPRAQTRYLLPVIRGCQIAVLSLAGCASSPAKQVSRISSVEPPAQTVPVDAFEVLAAGPEQIELVRRALASDDLETRLVGVYSAERVESPHNSLLPQIKPLARDPNHELRAAVAMVLPSIANEQNADQVLALLADLSKDPAIAVRIAALDAAPRMGPWGVGMISSIRRAATDPNPSVKVVAVAVACLVADTSQKPSLALPVAMMAIDDANEQVRVAAARGLGLLGNAARVSFDRLVVATADPSPEVRAASMYALGRIDPPRAWPECLKGIDDPAPQVIAMSGGCLKGVSGEPVTQLIARFQKGNRAIGRAMAILLAGADPSAAVLLSKAARTGNLQSRDLLVYSMWHLTRRSGHYSRISRWEVEGDWDREEVSHTLSEVAWFAKAKTSIQMLKWACQDRWGGNLLVSEGEDSLACQGHQLAFANIGVRTVVSDPPDSGRAQSRVLSPGADLDVTYQVEFGLAASDELGLQVALLQRLEDQGCYYSQDRLPENASCLGPGGEVEVRLAPGRGVVVIKKLVVPKFLDGREGQQTP